MTGLGQGKFTRADAIVRRFGVQKEASRWNARWLEMADGVAEKLAAECEPGQVVLIAGASGSGKSLLLRALGQRLGREAVVCAQTTPAGRLVVDCLPWLELDLALDALARFGLGEVYSYLSPAERLSTGQQSRLRLAMAYARATAGGGRVLLADEFGTQLDGFSAAVIARNLRRVVDQERRISAVVATCQDGLAKALRPELTVECDFGEYRLRRRDAGAIGR